MGDEYLEQYKRLLQVECENRTHPEGYCPPVLTELDGQFHCWNATPVGTVASAPCLDLANFDQDNHMHKECWPNGTWFIHPNNTYMTHWTNYSSCISSEALREYELYTLINRLFIIGYSISLGALIIGLVIFLSFRTLKCTRIRLHIHLFLSFIMNNIMWLIWYCEVIDKSGELAIKENPIWCQVLEIFLRYFLIANYMWMFCESLYLHISLVAVFVRDNIAWMWFVLIGWGVPLVIIALYAYARIFYFKDTKFCWIYNSPAEYIYSIPVCVTLLISFIFMCYVLRVIVTIMNPNSENPAPLRIKRAAKACFILIPLFGLHYMLLPFRPEKDHPYIYIYEYVTVCVTSLQGLCVSILFCFANQDVHQAVARSLRRRLGARGWAHFAAPAGDNSGGVFVINSSGNRTSIRLV